VKENNSTYDKEKDCLLINVNEKSELLYWSRKLGVSTDVLKTLAQDVGTKIDVIKKRLGEPR